MKLSEIPDYQTAVCAFIEGELSVARDAYHRLLEIAEASDDPTAISFLMHSLGNVEAKDGNLDLGHELHLRAVGQSTGVPLHLVMYAKGLAEHFGLPELAEEKLVEAEQLISSEKWNRRIDNISSESYAQQIAEIRSNMQV